MADRLTALDATFLELEEADQGAHMHIGGVMIFDPREDGAAPPLDVVCRHLRPRLGSLPRYCQRLSEPHTGGLRWPEWRDQPSFDLAAHVSRVRLPDPGGDDEVIEWASEFYSQRLDRTRPLWEIALIEGLADDRWALATKTHHCMVDGVGSVDVAYVILDQEPGGSDGEGPVDADRPTDGLPENEPERGQGLTGTGWELARRGGETVRRSVSSAARLALRPARAALDTARSPHRAREAMHAARALVEVVVRDELIAAPRTCLNVPIGGKRRLGVARISLAEIKEIKNALGGTVNDVVLALTAGAMRKLLLSRGEEPPAQGLRAMVPVNVRTAGEHLALGNKISSLFVALPVAEEDPLERYRAQVAEAESLKSGSGALGAATMIDVSSLAPPILHSSLARSMYATRLFNLTITNVPGPQQPLYAFGSRMREVWPIVPLAAEHAIALAVLSYDGELFFTFNADRDAVPDLDEALNGIRESLADLHALARGVS
ncbi:MAG TPA: wax ester/triacylglycerol synthase family O-acyltransferase [Solirubrobacterales bacterium]|nr:wax ester/triacylglycerol synthase family O-acyltransferase [Solirubrobacterales bacterium]